MLKLFFNLLIIIVLAVIQISLFGALPFFQHFHPVLFYIIYLSIKKDAFLPAAILGGYILDIYSSHPFGLHIAAMVLAAAFANYIYFNVVTNRRFFTMIILASASIVTYHASLLFGMTVLSFLKLSPKTSAFADFNLRGIGIEIISIAIIASVGYFVFYYARKKLSSRLLFKNGHYSNYAPK